jgi:hypothetical protein
MKKFVFALLLSIPIIRLSFAQTEKIDGTVQIIAWSDNYIYVQKKPLFSGEKKGWVIIDVKKQKITETISEQVMKERLSANGDSIIQFYSAESAWRKL